MKNILLLIHDDDGQEARLQVALDLCRAIDGHVTCLDVAWTPPPISSGFHDNAVAVADVLTQEIAREADNRAALERRLHREGVSWDWIDTAGDFAPCLEQAAGLADVIVVNRNFDAPKVFGMHKLATDLVLRSGKPVLAVPAGCTGLKFDAALIAWDGSTCAAAALRAAVPLLRHSARVDILTIEDGSVAVAAEEAAKYLSRHDIHAEIRRESAVDLNAGEMLMLEAQSGAHDYLVMGGFGHLRFVEALFGGVTRRLLKLSPIPLFLAH